MLSPLPLLLSNHYPQLFLLSWTVCFQQISLCFNVKLDNIPYILSLFTFLLLFFIIFYRLCYYSSPRFSPFVPLHAAPLVTPGAHITLFMFMGHVYKFFGYSIPFTVFYMLRLFCNYLFAFLNPLTYSPISLATPPIWQPSKCSPHP